MNRMDDTTKLALAAIGAAISFMLGMYFIGIGLACYIVGVLISARERDDHQ